MGDPSSPLGHINKHANKLKDIIQKETTEGIITVRSSCSSVRALTGLHFHHQGRQREPLCLRDWPASSYAPASVWNFCVHKT